MNTLYTLNHLIHLCVCLGITLFYSIIFDSPLYIQNGKIIKEYNVHCFYLLKINNLLILLKYFNLFIDIHMLIYV